MIDDDLFMTIEPLTPKYRDQFTIKLRSCINEINVNLDESIPQYLYSLGQNEGIIGLDFTGELISYALYNKQPEHPILLTHFWVHPAFRRRKAGTRMISHISYKEKHAPMMTILNECLWKAQEMLVSLGFHHVQTTHSEKNNCDQYKFIANAYSPMNRLADYYPSMF